MAFNTSPRLNYDEQQDEGFFEADPPPPPPPDSMQQWVNELLGLAEPHPAHNDFLALAYPGIPPDIIAELDRLQSEQDRTYAEINHRFECRRVTVRLHAAYERMEKAQNSVHEFHYYLNELDHDILQANWDPVHRAKVYQTLDYTLHWLEDAYTSVSEEFLAAFEHFGRCNDEYEAVVGGDGKWLFEDREPFF